MRLSILAGLLLLAVVVAVGVGAVSIAPNEVLGILIGQLGLEPPWTYSNQQETVLLAIRIPRVAATALVGAAWAVAGVAMQALYRTSLADPALVGIGAGATLGAALGLAVAVALGVAVQLSGTLLVTGVAFVAALIAAAVLYRVAAASGSVVVARMLLGGIALTAFFGAITAFVVTASRTAELGSVAFWSLGSFSGAVGRDVVVATIVTIPAAVILVRQGARLDALALGHAEARHLGINVPRLMLIVTVSLAALTAVAVAVAGVIAFVGLMVPSLVRGWIGQPHRIVIVGSALAGAMFLVIADVVARSILSPVELPLGVITTLLGAPFFLWLLLRDRGWLAQ